MPGYDGSAEGATAGAAAPAGIPVVGGLDPSAVARLEGPGVSKMKLRPDAPAFDVSSSPHLDPYHGPLAVQTRGEYVPPAKVVKQPPQPVIPPAHHVRVNPYAGHHGGYPPSHPGGRMPGLMPHGGRSPHHYTPTFHDGMIHDDFSLSRSRVEEMNQGQLMNPRGRHGAYPMHRGAPAEMTGPYDYGSYEYQKMAAAAAAAGRVPPKGMKYATGSGSGSSRGALAPDMRMHPSGAGGGGGGSHGTATAATIPPMGVPIPASGTSGSSSAVPPPPIAPFQPSSRNFGVPNMEDIDSEFTNAPEYQRFQTWELLESAKRWLPGEGSICERGGYRYIIGAPIHMGMNGHIHYCYRYPLPKSKKSKKRSKKGSSSSTTNAATGAAASSSSTSKSTAEESKASPDESKVSSDIIEPGSAAAVAAEGKTGEEGAESGGSDQKGQSGRNGEESVINSEEQIEGQSNGGTTTAHTTTSTSTTSGSGSGSSSSTKKGGIDLSKAPSVETVAAKIVPNTSAFAREIVFLRGLQGCENICTLYEVLESKRTLISILELAQADVYNFFVGKGAMRHGWTLEKPAVREAFARMVVTNAVQGLKQMHERGYLHCDLKSLNILLYIYKTDKVTRKGGVYMKAKLTDFGHSSAGKIRVAEKTFKNGMARVGTAGHVAPELFKERHPCDYKIDIWSLGIVMFSMLVPGRLLFGEYTCLADLHKAYERLHKINPWSKESRPKWWTDFERLSPEARDLILWMTKLDASERPSIDQIMQHPWFIIAKGNLEPGEYRPKLKEVHKLCSSSFAQE